MKVAIPWNLSTYIPLNSFHPLYKALIVYAPKNIDFNVWNTATLYSDVKKDEYKKRKIASAILNYDSNQIKTNWIKKQFDKEISLPDTCFSRWLPGDIEFLHTAPFPSMTRPFVFHCEAFLPVFFPFSHQGDGEIENRVELRDYYKSIFENPLCLGVFSHIPETLESFKNFFNSDIINSKLWLSRIGVMSQPKSHIQRSKEESVFLFINSAHQSTNNFIKRGGHVVLKFWEQFISDGRKGRLIIRCGRPGKNILKNNGVNIDFIEMQIGKSITWAEDYLPADELDTLVSFADFLLIPSASLHSVSILSAMKLGTIPVVTDTIGPENYVTDDVNGIVLSGVYQRVWVKDPVRHIMLDNYDKYDIQLSNDLANQMFSRIIKLLDAPDKLIAMQKENQLLSDDKFNPKNFSEDFWYKVEELYSEFKKNDNKYNLKKGNDSPIIDPDFYLLPITEIKKNFDSTTQPVARFVGASSSIYEYSGNYICFYGERVFFNKSWAFFEQFLNDKSPQVIFSRDQFLLEEYILPVSQSNVDGGTIHPVFVRKIADKVRGNLLIYYFFRFGYRLFKMIDVRLKGYIKYRRCVKRETNLESHLFMVAEGINGYNIVRFFGKYYAVKQSLGEFTIENYKKGLYGSIYSSYSLERVLKKAKKDSILKRIVLKISSYLNEYPRIKKNVRSIYIFITKR